jgi:hypothetical protein
MIKSFLSYLQRHHFKQVFTWANGPTREILATIILLLYEIRGENPQHCIDRSGEFALIEILYEGQIINLQCPLCKRRQDGVDRVSYELGKVGLLHGYTCGGPECPSHTYMEMIKSG